METEQLLDWYEKQERLLPRFRQRTDGNVFVMAALQLPQLFTETILVLATL
jgi:hypothetical protein